MTKELLPGLGSGALREALEQIASITCSCHDSADADWHGKRCPKGIALAALSLSSPIERCPDCEAAARHAHSDATTPGFFHDTCVKHRPTPQASSEIREALTAEQLQAEWYAVHESTGMNYLTTAGPKWFAAYAERINALSRQGAGGK